MKKILFLVTSYCYAGQSLVNSTSVSAAIPFRDNSLTTRLEFVFDDISSTSNRTLITSDALGLRAEFNSSLFRLSMLRSSSNPCSISTSGLTKISARITFIPAKNAIFCQVWNQSNEMIINQAIYLLSLAAGSGTGISVNVTGQNLAFLRIHNAAPTTPIEWATPPSVVDTINVLYHWKFDNSLTAFVGGIDFTGTAAYATTNQSVIPIASINGNSFTPILAIPTNTKYTLTGGGSTLNDTDANVTCKWRVTNAPVAIFLSNYNSCTPEILLRQNGTYQLNLTVTDSGGITSNKTFRIYAAAADYISKLVTTDVNLLPLIGGISIPGYGTPERVFIEERLDTGVTLQSTNATSQGFPVNGPDWVTNNTSGTISYVYGGRGTGGLPGTTLSSGINSTDLTINVTDATRLELSTLPTWIRLSSGSTIEVIRICSVVGNQLTVCDGYRGVATPLDNLSPSAWSSLASSFSAGALVAQVQITGSSTNFTSDATKPLCGAGVPGPPGTLTYSTGTATINVGSTSITGVGTAWITAGITANMAIRFNSTRSAVSAPFWARITAVGGETSITIDRPVPTGFDSATVTYGITTINNWALEYLMQDSRGVTLSGRKLKAYHTPYGCESNTQAHAIAYYDITFRGAQGVQQTAVNYSTYTGGFNVQNNFGPNFYGPGLGAFSHYLRTGNSNALTLTKQLDDYWIDHPYAINGILLNRFGGIVGAIACKVGRADCLLDWRDIRAAAYYTPPSSCNDADSRDFGAAILITALMAYYDPDSASRTVWENNLDAFYTRELTCSATPGFPTGAYFNTGGATATLTNGSTAVTGSGFTSGLCKGTGVTGTATATNNSATLTSSGTFTAGGDKIVLWDGTNQKMFQYSFVNSSQIALSGTWPYASGTVNWMQLSSVFNGGDPIVFGNSTSDSTLASNFGCIFNSSTSLTLSKPWPYASGSYKAYSQNVAGIASQPFMVAIRLWSYYVAGLVDSNWNSLISSQISWLANNGYDTRNNAIYYARFCEFCEDPTTTTPQSNFTWLFPNFAQGTTRDTILEGRTQIGEFLQGLFAGSMTGISTYNTNGNTLFSAAMCSPWDSDVSDCQNANATTPDADNLGNASLSIYKWFGFWFGTGKIQSWKTSRENPIAPSSTTNIVAINGNRVIKYTTRSGVVGTQSCNNVCSFSTVNNPVSIIY